MKRMKKQINTLLILMFCVVLAGCNDSPRTELDVTPEEKSFQENMKKTASDLSKSADQAARELGEEMKGFGDDVNEEMKEIGGKIGKAFEEVKAEFQD